MGGPDFWYHWLERQVDTYSPGEKIRIKAIQPIIRKQGTATEEFVRVTGKVTSTQQIAVGERNGRSNYSSSGSCRTCGADANMDRNVCLSDLGVYQVPVEVKEKHATNSGLLQLNLFEKRDLMALLRGDPPVMPRFNIQQMALQ